MSVAASTDRNWKASLFGRRKSLPQITKASYIARNSQSSSEDTLCSEYCCDTLMSSPHDEPRHEHFVINEDYELSSSIGVVDRLDQLAQGLPLGRDQLVISTRLQPDTKLHYPESPQVVISLLQHGYDPNQPDQTHDCLCPIHTIVQSRLSGCLEALLVYSDVAVNACAAHMMSALHFAAMAGDMRCVKLLLAFGADINAISKFDQTPMNIAVAHDQENIIKLLEALKGITAAFVEPIIYRPLPVVMISSCIKHYHPLSPASSDGELELATRFSSNQFDHFDQDVPMESIRTCDSSILTQTHLHNLFTFNEEELVTMAKQDRPFFHYPLQHLMHTLTFRQHDGHRLLCLDGGWMRSLTQIDMLEQLENFTGQKVTEMFDVLIGSSSGALIILGLVYGECSLSSLRQFFFRMKQSLFANSPHELSYNTALLKNYIRGITGRDLKMSDIKHPLVMVPAVYKEKNDLQLKFFTNFADDIYSQESVFKVALSATATPSWFSSNANFFDGSVIANNPTDYALSYLQCHYYLLRQQFPVSLVVSLGAGIYNNNKVRGTKPPSPTKYKENVDKMQKMTMIMKKSILQSEEVSTQCACRCQKLGIKYYRFSPHLKETVALTETDTRKLINMILRSRVEMHDRNTGTEALKQYFIKLTDSYNASGSGLGPYSSSDTTSPDGLEHPLIVMKRVN